MSSEPSHPVNQPKGPKEIPKPIRPTRNRDRQARRNGRRPKGRGSGEGPDPQTITPEEDQAETSGTDATPGDEHTVDYLA